MNSADDTTILIHQAESGDSSALGQLLVRHRDRLLRIIGFRMDRRLKGRIDPADIVQEAYIDATARFDAYLADRPMPFFLWLRFLAVQKLAEMHRHHLGVKARNADREVSLFGGPLPQATSAVLAAQLLGKHTSPSEAAIRAETKLRLEEQLNALDAMDREVLALRHFEHLSNAETARVLGIGQSAASNRYVRAAKRLKEAMDGV